MKYQNVGMRCHMRGSRHVVASGLVVVLALAAARQVVAAPSADATPIGKKVDAFSLPDHHGQQLALADLSDKQAIVVVFLGTECPLAKSYAPRLAELAKEFAPKGVAFVGV